MGIVYEERASDSPYIETITRGRTVGNGSTIRPAEVHWHMVFTRYHGNLYPFVVGPWTTSGVVSFTEGAEILWIKFKLGAFMPHLPARDFRNKETVLPEAASNSFWLKGSAWQFPDYENVEAFVGRLVREEVLVRDSIVDAAVQDQLPNMPARTVRHRFLQATGLSQSHIFQVERAQRAAARLEQGAPIIDTVYELGYFDQPHMTRALKQYTGFTPGQVVQLSQPT
ncbi:MAG: helix-turn-helix domain-containing protein [Anaerolineales bacterium]|jgi:AraC-like DNA-binding protein